MRINNGIMSNTLKIVGGITASFVLSATAVIAEPLQGPTDNGFYSPPTVFDGAHGDLIWYRQAELNLGARTPSVSAWNVLYHSTDSLGAPNKVTVGLKALSGPLFPLHTLWW